MRHEFPYLDIEGVTLAVTTDRGTVQVEESSAPGRPFGILPMVDVFNRALGAEILRLAEENRALKAENRVLRANCSWLTATLQEDVAALCRATGIGDHARPVPPHEVLLNEVLPAIAKLRYELFSRTHSDEGRGDRIEFQLGPHDSPPSRTTP